MPFKVQNSKKMNKVNTKKIKKTDKTTKLGLKKIKKILQIQDMKNEQRKKNSLELLFCSENIIENSFQNIEGSTQISEIENIESNQNIQNDFCFRKLYNYMQSNQVNFY